MTFQKVIANGYSCGPQIVVFFVLKKIVSTHQTQAALFSNAQMCASPGPFVWLLGFGVFLISQWFSSRQAPAVSVSHAQSARAPVSSCVWLFERSFFYLTTQNDQLSPPQLFHSLVAYIFNDFLKRSARCARSVRPRLAYFSAKTALPNRQSLHFNHEQRFMWIFRYVQLTRRSAIETLPYVIIIY